MYFLFLELISDSTRVTSSFVFAKLNKKFWNLVLSLLLLGKILRRSTCFECLLFIAHCWYRQISTLWIHNPYAKTIFTKIFDSF